MNDEEMRWSPEAEERLDKWREIMPDALAEAWEIQDLNDSGHMADHEDRAGLRRGAEFLTNWIAEVASFRAEQLALDEAKENEQAAASAEVELRHIARGLHQAMLQTKARVAQGLDDVSGELPPAEPPA